MQISFEKHKIFLYKEDFDKFMEGMNDVINYIKQRNSEDLQAQAPDAETKTEDKAGHRFLKGGKIITSCFSL